MRLTVYGASDDLIEFRGNVTNTDPGDAYRVRRSGVPGILPRRQGVFRAGRQERRSTTPASDLHQQRDVGFLPGAEQRRRRNPGDVIVIAEGHTMNSKSVRMARSGSLLGGARVTTLTFAQRARVVLRNMAAERPGVLNAILGRRWVIADEPLRGDAQRLLAG